MREIKNLTVVVLVNYRELLPLPVVNDVSVRLTEHLVIREQVEREIFMWNSCIPNSLEKV